MLIQEAYPHPLVVVVSAMGKTTHQLEEILQCRVEGRPYVSKFQKLYKFHRDNIDQLLDDSREAAYQMLDSWHEELAGKLAASFSATSFEKVYSHVVAGGELLTSRLIAYYLQELNVACAWLDARDYVKTSSGFCHAQVDWVATQRLVQKGFLPLLKQGRVVLTQGFIGSNKAGETTTLGKEGSDFTGAILATVLGAESLIIWKDVPGVMSADPKLFKEATKFDRLSYQAMAKLAFYGAKVVHPKTIQPLAKHNIPLYVKPFHQPNESGTAVTNEAVALEHPVYILQEEQVLVQLSLADLSFFDEAQMQEVTRQLWQHNLQANLIETGACKLTICLNDDRYQIKRMSAALSPRFKVNSQAHVKLLTVLHHSDRQLRFEKERVLLAQQGPGRYQAVLVADSQTL